MNGWINSKHLLLLVVFALLLPVLAFAQSKKELEEKRKKILRDIQSTERMIQKTSKNKAAAYDRYLALQSQIRSREALIRNLQAEITATENGILRNQNVIASLGQDVTKMREEYALTVRTAYRRKTLSNPLLFILSADNLNQAFRRWLFLRKYDERRREQAEAIRQTQEMLSNKTATLKSTRMEKEQLLVSVQAQKATLLGEMTEKNALLEDLKKDEGRLKTDLEQKQIAHEALNATIEKIIREEVRKRVDEARSKPANPVAEVAEKRPESPSTSVSVEKDKPAIRSGEDNVSFNFRKNKGRLPWPVESGFISRGFGKHQHPSLKNIEITNNGVDIRTEEGAIVRCVAEGVVAGVQFVPGHDYTVIVQHGDFYTVYSNLASTKLGKGDALRSKDVIGEVATNNITGTSELHFEVWQQKERMNPALWIKK